METASSVVNAWIIPPKTGNECLCHSNSLLVVEQVSAICLNSYYPTALILILVQISRGICTPEDRLDRFPAID